MRAGRTAIIAVLAGFGLLTTACGGQTTTGTASSTSSPTASSQSSGGTADPAKIKFADGICGAMGKFLGPATQFKPDTSNPTAAVESLKKQLGTISTGLGDAVSDLKNVDTSGVPDG